MSGQTTLLQQAKNETIRQTLDQVENGAKEIQGEVLSTGEVETGVNVPITGGPRWIRGSTVTAFVKAKAQQFKETIVGGFRISKKF